MADKLFRDLVTLFVVVNPIGVVPGQPIDCCDGARARGKAVIIDENLRIGAINRIDRKGRAVLPRVKKYAATAARFQEPRRVRRMRAHQVRATGQKVTRFTRYIKMR
jgi:hypothetical protein